MSALELIDGEEHLVLPRYDRTPSSISVTPTVMEEVIRLDGGRDWLTESTERPQYVAHLLSSVRQHPVRKQRVVRVICFFERYSS